MVLKLTKFALLIALPASGCVARAPARPTVAPEPGEWVVREAYLMGTGLRLEVRSADRAAGLAATERALERVRRLEGVLSSWRDDSEIGRINAAPVGQPVQATPELWSLLEEAREWAARTGGSFDPAVGSLIDAWGVRGEGRRPTAAELERARAAAGLDAFRFDAAARTVTRRAAGAWLDTGGFGKGAALRDAAAALREAGVGSALLNFGGQVLALGGPPDGGEAWPVWVAHPSRRDEPVLELRLRDVSVSTTAQSERWVEVGGERWGHVLDPRTGRPVPAWGSVTVVAEDALVADALSTALFVMGAKAAREWAADHAGIGVLVLEERDGRLVPSWNDAMRRHLGEYLPRQGG